MGKPGARRFFVCRLAWLPFVTAGAALVPFGFVVPALCVVATVVLAARYWHGVVLTGDGLEVRRVATRRLLVPWHDCRTATLEPDALRLTTVAGRLRLGPELAGWPELVKAVREHVPHEPEGAALTPSDIAAALGHRPFLVLALRPLTHTLCPLLVVGSAFGALVLAVTGGKVVSSSPGPGLVVPVALAGAVLGAVLMAFPALVLSLPLLVQVRPSGLLLVGPSRLWRRRPWSEVRGVFIRPWGWQLHTEHETLGFLNVGAGSRRLEQAAEQVLAARRQGRPVAWHGDVPDQALSRTSRTAVAADRGLSRPT